MNKDTPSGILPGQQHVLNIEGFIQTLSAAPTYTPRRFSEQVVVVVSGGSKSLYVYDVTNALWRQATLV
mgnify:CR=1 FL=1